MDVRFSAEQRALADAAAQLVGRLGPRTVPGLDDAERQAKLDAAVDSSGWLELRTGSDDATPWGSGVEVGIVAEALGRGAADTAFVGPTLAADLRRRCGAATATRPEAVVVDGGLVLDVPQGCDTALVLVPDGDASVVGSVRIADAVTTTDLTRRVARLAPDVPVEPLAGSSPLDGGDIAAWRALGLAASCADLVGSMGAAVRLAVDYAAERSQYGHPVGSFQAVQHLLADAHVQTEGSRSVALHAAWAVDALDPEMALDAACAAMAYCGRAGLRVCEAAIQVHGGIGNTWECMAHVHLRRSLLSSSLFGGVEAALDRVLARRLDGSGRTGDGLR